MSHVPGPATAAEAHFDRRNASEHGGSAGSLRACVQPANPAPDPSRQTATRPITRNGMRSLDRTEGNGGRKLQFKPRCNRARRTRAWPLARDRPSRIPGSTSSPPRCRSNDCTIAARGRHRSARPLRTRRLTRAQERSVGPLNLSGENRRAAVTAAKELSRRPEQLLGLPRDGCGVGRDVAVRQNSNRAPNDAVKGRPTGGPKPGP